MATRRKIVYLTSGNPHCPYLVVSIYTLRQHWSGPIEVYSWPDSIDITRQIAKDIRLGITHCAHRDPPFRRSTHNVGGNSQFLHKQKLMQTINTDEALYLDADTSIHADPNPLLDELADTTFVATQWNEWVTNGSMVSKRIKSLEGCGVPEDLIKSVTSRKLPSVNGGVFCCRPHSPVLPKWHEWTLMACPNFISDEKVLHLMHDAFGPEHFKVVGGWNTAPNHKPPSLKDEDVKIWHYHGDSNVRPNKSKKGVALWWPLFEECRDKNIGFMNDWLPDIKNKYLARLIDDSNTK